MKEQQQGVAAEGSYGGGTPAVPDLIEQSVTVRFSFPVHFTRGLFRPGNDILLGAITHREPQRTHRIFAVIDEGVAEAWPELGDAIARYAQACSHSLRLVSEPRILPGGEVAKNDSSVVEQVVGWINEYGIDRQSFILCVGGGSLQDAVGFAAAISHRGVRLIRVPTTVLAQNDSGVGVKNGINSFGKKNFIGAFAPPFAVLNDLDFIRTLDRRELIAGTSEAVKVALIKDANFFGWIEANVEALAAGDDGALEVLIRRCAQLHLHHIATSGDPFEFGSARPLDYGHWAAHRLEGMTEHRITHGEAVGIGLALDTIYAGLAGKLSDIEVGRIVSVLERLGFRLWDAALDDRDDSGQLRVLTGLREFREHLGGELSITLLEGIGKSFEAREIDEALMRQSLERLRARDEARCA